MAPPPCGWGLPFLLDLELDIMPMSYPFESHPHGAARFAATNEIRQAGLLGRTGVEIGHLGRRILRHYKGGGGKITGGSGCGKTSQIALPMIFGSPHETFVLLDFKKAELSRVIEPHCALHGIPFYTIDPLGVSDYPKLRVNLLSYLSASSSTLVPDAQRFMLAILPESGGGEAMFFEQTARRFGDAILRLLVAANGHVSFLSFYTAVMMARSNLAALLEMADHAQDRLPTDILATVAEMAKLEAETPKMFDSIMAGRSNALSFMADAQLQDSLVDDELADFALDVIAVGHGPVIVALILPDELLEVLAPVVRAFLSAVRTAKKKRPDAPQIHVLIDEAARMGRFGELAQMFAVDRSAGIVPYLFYQDDGQIIRNLGRTGKDTLEANAALMLDLGGGIRDFETAQARARMLGTRTVEVDDPLVQARAAAARQELQRKVLLEGMDPVEAGMQLQRLDYEAGHRTRMAKALMSPQELMNMPPSHMLVQARGYLPRAFLAEKQAYYLQRRFAGQFFPNPNEERDVNAVRLRTRWGLRKRAIMTAPLPAQLKDLPQYAGGLRPFRFVDGFAPKPPRSYPSLSITTAIKENALMSDQDKNRPVDQRQLQNVRAKIWENQNAHGVHHNTTFSRVYRNDEGQVREAQSFGSRDLLALGHLSNWAVDTIQARRAALNEHTHQQPQPERAQATEQNQTQNTERSRARDDERGR